LGRSRSLLPSQVRVRVAAVGVNFRDVLNVLGMYPGEAGPPGSDCAGIVMAAGTRALEEGVRVGDSVFGIAHGCLGSVAVADQGTP
jgi:NADPH:quinone reductase-like Zn-dependent oxidoreductase